MAGPSYQSTSWDGQTYSGGQDGFNAFQQAAVGRYNKTLSDNQSIVNAVQQRTGTQIQLGPDGEPIDPTQKAEWERIKSYNTSRTSVVNALTDQAGRQATILTGTQPGQPNPGLKKTPGFNPTSIL